MKVFGIGLNKTGTTTLGSALEVLGFKNHQSYNLELTKYWSQNNLEPILTVAKENNNFEDWPWPLVYKELYEEFDDAKFILTKRASADKWFESFCKHSLLTTPEFRKLIYGYHYPHDFKEKTIDFYNQHNENVINFFNKNAPEKLLVITLEENANWENLCPFLEMDIPNSDFPFLNKAQLPGLTVRNKHVVKVIKNLQKLSLFVDKVKS